MEHTHVHEHDDHPVHLHWHAHGPHCDPPTHAHDYGSRVVLVNAAHGDDPDPVPDDGGDGHAYTHQITGSDAHHAHLHSHVDGYSPYHHHSAGNGSRLATRRHLSEFHSEREDADGVTDVSIDDDPVL